MGKQDSKALWLRLRKSLPENEVRLGTPTGQAYVGDPKHLVFTGARYKFVAKMLAGRKSALEIGCCDAFGSPIVAQSVGKLICTDIDEEVLADNRQRLKFLKNVEFKYHDFRAAAFPRRVDAVFHVDVLEHIFAREEGRFMRHIVQSLNPHGIMVVGTPSITGDAYASKYSRIGHINLKDHRTLRQTCEEHFHNVFIFSMNDEVVHTGFYPMAHYLWALCTESRAAAPPKRRKRSA